MNNWKILVLLSCVHLTLCQMEFLNNEIEDYIVEELAWSDEFDNCTSDNKPNPDNWGYENGFVRNHEQQYYTQKNAICNNGKLTITAE